MKEFFKGYAEEDDRCSYVDMDCSGDGKHSLADSLVDYALEQEADFLGVGCDGVGSYTAGKKETVLGSFSDRVVKMAQLSVVIVQNREASYDDTTDEVDAGKVAHVPRPPSAACLSVTPTPHCAERALGASPHDPRQYSAKDCCFVLKMRGGC